MFRHILLRACTDALKRSSKHALTRSHLVFVCVVRGLRAWALSDSQDAEHWLKKVHSLQWCDSATEVPSQTQLAGRRLAVFMVRVAMEIETTESEDRKTECLKLMDRGIEYLENSCTDTTIKKELLSAFTDNNEQTYISENIA